MQRSHNHYLSCSVKLDDTACCSQHWCFDKDLCALTEKKNLPLPLYLQLYIQYFHSYPSTLWSKLTSIILSVNLWSKIHHVWHSIDCDFTSTRKKKRVFSQWRCLWQTQRKHGHKWTKWSGLKPSEEPFVVWKLCKVNWNKLRGRLQMFELKLHFCFLIYIYYPETGELKRSIKLGRTQLRKSKMEAKEKKKNKTFPILIIMEDAHKIAHKITHKI